MRKIQKNQYGNLFPANPILKDKFSEDLRYLRALGHKAQVKNGKLYSMGGAPISVINSGGKRKYSTRTSSGKTIWFTNNGKFNSDGSHEKPELKTEIDKITDTYSKFGKRYNPVTRAVDKWREDTENNKTIPQKLFNSAVRGASTVTNNIIGDPLAYGIDATFGNFERQRLEDLYIIEKLENAGIDANSKSIELVRKELKPKDREQIQDRVINSYENLGKVMSAISPSSWLGTAWDATVGQLYDIGHSLPRREVLMPWEGLTGLFGDSEAGELANFVADIFGFGKFAKAKGAAKSKLKSKLPKTLKTPGRLYSTTLPGIYSLEELLGDWENLTTEKYPWISLYGKDTDITKLIDTYDRIGAGKVAETDGVFVTGNPSEPIIGRYDTNGVKPLPVSIADAAALGKSSKLLPTLKTMSSGMIAGNRGVHDIPVEGYNWNSTGGYHTFNTSNSPFTAAYYLGVGKVEANNAWYKNILDYLESLPLGSSERTLATNYVKSLYEELINIVGERLPGENIRDLRKFNPSVISDPVKRLKAEDIINKLMQFDGLGRAGYIQIQGIKNNNYLKGNASGTPFDNMLVISNKGTLKLSKAPIYMYTNKNIPKQKWNSRKEVWEDDTFRTIDKVDGVTENISTVLDVKNPDKANTILVNKNSAIRNSYNAGGKIKYFN